MGSKEMEEEEDEGPPPGWQSIPLPSSQPPAPAPAPAPAPPSPSEMAQMVCGTCRNLLKYPRGARHVHCSCCHTGNFVLEAQIIVDLRRLSSTFDTKFQIIMTTHEVGLFKCGNCKVLLMYQHGASSVKCSSCSFVTEIGEHNRRPPWSVQQGQPPQPPNPVH